MKLTFPLGPLAVLVAISGLAARAAPSSLGLSDELPRFESRLGSPNEDSELSDLTGAYIVSASIRTGSIQREWRGGRSVGCGESGGKRFWCRGVRSRARPLRLKLPSFLLSTTIIKQMKRIQGRKLNSNWVLMMLTPLRSSVGRV